MPYFAAAGLALSVIGGMGQGKAQEIQYRVQAANRYQQNLISTERELKGIMNTLEQQQKSNQAIAKADLQTLINTNFTAGLMNLQQAMQRRQTASNIQRLGETELQALASAETAAAATGSVGASVDAVATDVQRQVGEAIIQERHQNDMQTFNLQTQLRNLYQGYMDSRVEIDQSTPDIPGMPVKGGAAPVSAGRAGIAAGLDYAGDYLKRFISLDMGSGFDVGPFLNSSLSTSIGNMGSFTPSTPMFRL